MSGMADISGGAAPQPAPQEEPTQLKDALFSEGIEDVGAAAQTDQVDAPSADEGGVGSSGGESQQPDGESSDEDFNPIAAGEEGSSEETTSQDDLEHEIEGFKIKLPKEIAPENQEVKAFMKLLKETQGKPEAAQKLFDMYRSKVGDVMKFLEQKNAEFRENLNRQWIKENMTDSEFGGGNYEVTRKEIGALIRRFVPKEEIVSTTEANGKMGFEEYLQATMVGNAPPMFRLLARIAKHLREAEPLHKTTYAAPLSETKRAADVLFNVNKEDGG